MRRECLANLVRGVALVCAAGAVLAGTPTEDADAAFYAGDHDRAMELYAGVLESDPDNPVALLRLGKLLSWDGQFGKAIERYDRVLEIEPDNYPASLERAKVLSWDRQYGAGAEEFRKLLEQDPRDVEVRLGLARCLSWGGDQPAARKEYLTALGQSPRNADVMVGIAQSYGWLDNPERSRMWYEYALDAEPGKKEAVLGLAYLDLRDRNTAAAGRRVGELHDEFPEDNEVDDLQKAYRQALAPWIRASAETLADTDGNDMDTLRVEGGLGLPVRVDLTFGAARYAMRNDVLGRGSINSLYAILGWVPATYHQLTFRAGVDLSENSFGQSGTTGIGGIAYRWTFLPEWNFVASAQRDPMRYSVEILDNGIVIDSFLVGAEGRPFERWRLEGDASYWNLSDGNTRINGAARAWYELMIGSQPLDLGYGIRYMTFSEDTFNGYFEPSQFFSNLFAAQTRGKFGRRRNYYRVGLILGTQSFTLHGDQASNDLVYGFDGVLGFPFRDPFAIEVFATFSDYAGLSATGFESHQVGVRFRWRGGP